MPLYEYRCDACGQEFTARQGWHDPPLERCPNCGARPRKLIALPAIVFKGSGWHITDYRPKSSSDGASESKGEAKGDGKSDAKSGTKTESSSKKSDAP